MPNQFPNNNRSYTLQRLRELIATELRAACDTLATGRTLALNDPLVKVHEYEQFPKTPKEKDEVEAVNDPVVGQTHRLTSFIEITLPGVREDPYTDDTHTQITIDFPMDFVMGVAQWDDPGFPFPSSVMLFEAVYAACAERLKNNRTFGYDNVTHFYLQQTFAETERDEESDEAVGHRATWLLSVVVAGARA